MHLGGHGVDSINDIIVIRIQQPLGCLGRIKLRNGAYTAGRIDIAHACGEDIRLALSDRGGQGTQLAVAVGIRNLVMIDQCQCADTGTRQRFDCKAAHAAQTEHEHMRALQPFDRLLAEQHLCAQI